MRNDPLFEPWRVPGMGGGSTHALLLALLGCYGEVCGIPVMVDMTQFNIS